MSQQYKYQSILGDIWLVEKDGAITNLIFGDNSLEQVKVAENNLLKMAYKQLEEYFKGKRKYFDLPMKAEGTQFQQEVWQALMQIPYGEVCSYKDIAIKIKNEKAYRAVGMANNRNPLPIFIPCHRVIGKSGELIGYAGGLKIKEMLINLENLNSI